jgi:hypothetical protein
MGEKMKRNEEFLELEDLSDSEREYLNRIHSQERE